MEPLCQGRYNSMVGANRGSWSRFIVIVLCVLGAACHRELAEHRIVYITLFMWHNHAGLYACYASHNILSR